MSEFREILELPGIKSLNFFKYILSLNSSQFLAAFWFFYIEFLQDSKKVGGDWQRCQVSFLDLLKKKSIKKDLIHASNFYFRINLFRKSEKTRMNDEPICFQRNK